MLLRRILSMTEKFRWNMQPFLLTQYQDMHTETYDTMSEVLERYYAEKNTITRIRQKSSDLRRIVQTALDRSRKNTIFRKNS